MQRFDWTASRQGDEKKEEGVKESNTREWTCNADKKSAPMTNIDRSFVPGRSA